MIVKPLVTVSGRKTLFNSTLHRRIAQDLPQEGVDWRRRHDSNSKPVYIDVDFVDFDVDNVERSSEQKARLSLNYDSKANIHSPTPVNDLNPSKSSINQTPEIEQDKTTQNQSVNKANNDLADNLDSLHQLNSDYLASTHGDNVSNIGAPHPQHSTPRSSPPPLAGTQNLDSSLDQLQKSAVNRLGSLQLATDANNLQTTGDVSLAFFNQRLLGRPILHTYWADKTDFEGDNQKCQFDEWIGQVQASTCTEWAIIVIEDGDLKTKFGTALFKSKIQSNSSSNNQANVSTGSISSSSQFPNSSFLDRMKKGLSNMFHADSKSDRWLTLIEQGNQKNPDAKAQESYTNFIKKFRTITMASFSKQIELFEEQLRVHRELRTDKKWNFLSYFSMQEELASAFEFLTLFDEALVQYDLLDALFSEYISSPSFNQNDELRYEQWITFNSWPGICLDLNNNHFEALRNRIIDNHSSLLDMRNYLFAKKCDLMLMQNQPWRVAASTASFLNNCISEHKCLNIQCPPGALLSWSFVCALEVLQKCECYSCTSTMENYSFHTVDIWNEVRKNLQKLGNLTNLLPGMTPTDQSGQLVQSIIAGLGNDPHSGVSYQKNSLSPYARLRESLSSEEKFAENLIEMSELTIDTYRHIGRKRHALLVSKELADFYMARVCYSRALPYLMQMERTLKQEKWTTLCNDVQQCIDTCRTLGQNEADDNTELTHI